MSAPVSWKRLARRQAVTTSAAATLTPRDVSALYGLDAYYGRGVYGQGQSIGFIEFARPDAGDDARFWRTFSLAPQFNAVAATIDVDRAASDPGALDETDLDLQYAGALAPAARLVAYVISDSASPAVFLGQLYDALQRAAADGIGIISISLGTGELGLADTGPITAPLSGRAWPDSASYLPDLDALVQRNGLLVFVAAGDAGAYAGLPYGDLQPQPSWPAVQPAMIAVGGTQLTSPGNLPSGEEAWGGQTLDRLAPGYSAANTLPQASGGGGVSAIFAAPPDQAALGLGGRATPDICAFSGPLVIADHGQQVTIWGTSAAAPIAAAITALAAQAAGALPTRGQVLARAQDVCLGNNWNSALWTQGLTTFFSAGPGYDLCTGWGRVVI